MSVKGIPLDLMPGAEEKKEKLRVKSKELRKKCVLLQQKTKTYYS